MNLLVVDIGNTSIVLGIYRDDELVASWRVATSRERTVDEYGILARQLILSTGIATIDASIVSSVVPPLDGMMREMMLRYFDVDPLFVQPGIKTALSIKTENPLEVGADRIVNAVATWHLYGGPAIIVDFGTATTFDVLSGDAEYRGGIIAPGLEIAAESLFGRAARLPRVDLRKPAQLIGTNTVASLQSGLFYGYVGLVEGILRRLIDEIGEVKTVVATGGAAPLLAKESGLIDRIDPDLTLRGLKILHDRNRRGGKGRSR